MKGKTRRPATLIILACLAVLAGNGCKDLNDNPPPIQEETARINIEELQLQMNANPGAREEGADRSVTITNTGVSSAARKLLVGAFLRTGSSTPVPSDYEITGSVTTFIGDSLTDSADFLQLIDLPTASSYIEFKVPPQSAGNWQVGAIAFSTQPETINDISASEHKFSAVSAGFNASFFAAEDIGNTPIPVKIKRVCLMSSSPPNGCASFGATRTADPVVTASVEIVGVRVNGKDYTPKTVDFPIIVRTAANVTTAVANLKTIRTEITGSQTAASLTVRVTHAENTTESSACRALAGTTNRNEHTNTQLRTHCEVTDHTVYY